MKILANNLPVASGVVLVDRNRIAVEVKQMLPRLPGSQVGPNSRQISLNQAYGLVPPIPDLLHPRR